MATAINKKNRKRCKAMSTTELRNIIATLEPEVRAASSLLECAKHEYRKRSRRDSKQGDGSCTSSSD